MDVGDEIAGGNQYRYANQHRCDIDEDDKGDVDFNGNGVHVISGGVKFDEWRIFLQQ